jgi:adenine-specific DNA-methyltransferase
MANCKPKTRLELTWIGKENRPRLEPRVLVENPSKSYHAKVRRGEGDLFDNRLIFGDNLLALKALEAEFAGKVNCVYIDPPYNTGSAFAQYDDGVEHSLWLSLIRDRLEILRSLLANDGSVWVQIDDNEQAYLKVVMDEVFGRANFIGTIVWQKKYATKSDTEFVSESHEYILVYAKDRAAAKLYRLPRTSEQDARYDNPDGDPRGPWTSGPLQRNEARDYAIFPIVAPGGRRYLPPKGTSWRFTKERVAELIADNRIWFGKSGNNVPRFKRFLSDVSETVPATTWWDYRESGHNDEARRESKALSGDEIEVFATPKPERLLARVLALATRPGDLVLDSFAGSGTTGAVAHKMGRRWIMVELGEHCHTHIIPRMQKVIDGTDPGGVTEATGWKGGGGFRYYRLAPSLLERDSYGQLVINKSYNAAMLAEAVCKLEGFRYEPSTEVYWQHGRSTENDFIYVTTQTMNAEMLQKLSDEVGEKRTLAVYCLAFRAGGARSMAERFPNLTVKKIPKVVVDRCEWGKDDYSLEIKNLPEASREPEELEAEPGAGHREAKPAKANAKAKRRARAPGAAETSLFSGGDADGKARERPAKKGGR